MYVIKYTKSPRGYYVGYIKGAGRLHFFAAESESKLFDRGARSAYEHFRAGATQVCMDAKPMAQDDFPSNLIDHKWYCMWWSGMRKDGTPAAPMHKDGRYSFIKKKLQEKAKKIEDKKIEDKKIEDEKIEPAIDKTIPSFEYHFSKRVGNKIYIYGCAKVAEYDAEPMPNMAAAVQPFGPTELLNK